jgi:hypothetical protein
MQNKIKKKKSGWYQFCVTSVAGHTILPTKSNQMGGFFQ